MRITSQAGLGPAAQVVGVARRDATGAATKASTFALPSARETAPATAAMAAAPLAHLDMVLALQGAPDRAERRRRQRRRADGLLDRLDEIRLALLDDELPLATLERLRRQLSVQVETSGDASLDCLVREIEVRAAVEAAKLAA